MIRRGPLLAIPMSICLFSLIGMPPFGGFIAKWWLLFALAESGGSMPLLIWPLIIIAVLNTLISLFYYVKVIREMALRDDGAPAVSAPLGGLLLANGCAVVLILTGTLLAPLLKPTAEAYSRNLFGVRVATEVVRAAGGDSDARTEVAESVER